MLKKLTLNTDNKAETVSECGRAAWARARRVFAVGSGGECYSSMDAHRVFHKDGQAGDCTDDLIGGAESVYVFALTGKVLLSTPTCYSVEDNAVSEQSSNCELAKPPPDIKVCCEDVCKDNCYKTKDGAYCVIPFIYRGKTHYECTRKDGGPMWCATTSNFDRDDQGGECEEEMLKVLHPLLHQRIKLQEQLPAVLAK
ncbi:cation-independent mannose-6-phosphate receptor-like [Paramuricea clavata]|uniref:Cation-independent mannose-6-phosphate receptor-like n=1 Tax=Paramuricea clavata TaxID=317549 RepID=A0A6S7IQX3_PARCT|nr:cation-independent mannose-6-phosphate receptor-like [Paramuricea clavata]